MIEVYIYNLCDVQQILYSFTPYPNPIFLKMYFLHREIIYIPVYECMYAWLFTRKKCLVRQIAQMSSSNNNTSRCFLPKEI